MRKGTAGILAACLALAALPGNNGRAESESLAEAAVYASGASLMKETAEESSLFDETGESPDSAAETEPGAVPASAVTPPEAFRLLQKGSKGDDVRALQLRLQELGYDPGTPDGIYGSGTKEAVKAF